MRFILVETARDPFKAWAYELGWHSYRATCGTAGIDMFFFALDADQAKRLVRSKFPECSFSDEDEQCRK